MGIEEVEIQRILEELNAPQLFKDIVLSIDDPICVRSQGCKLCVDKCPTKALYMGNKVELISGLCNGCGGCVRVCMVPGCMTLTRTRIDTNRIEKFSTPNQIQKIDNARNALKRQTLISRLNNSKST